VLSLQNGVDNIERIRAAADLEALAAAVYVGAEMVGPGHVKHTARGDLVIGDTPRPQVDRIAKLFVDASVPCRISDNLQGELWAKLIMNCAYNAMSAMGRVPYGRITGNPYTHDIIRLAVEEVLAVAKAAGIRMPDGDRVALAWKLAESMPKVVSSTAQDVSRHKPTEIDALNGYIARRGAELGVATPVNQTLHALVKLLEEPA
jgi:2-dehydropantoate 2-reductase